MLDMLGMDPTMNVLATHDDEDKRSQTRRIMDDRRGRGLPTDGEVRRAIRRRLRNA